MEILPHVQIFVQVSVRKGVRCHREVLHRLWVGLLKQLVGGAFLSVVRYLLGGYARLGSLVIWTLMSRPNWLFVARRDEISIGTLNLIDSTFVNPLKIPVLWRQS